ncbi:MAG: very short patch repair endonuclease [Planctomycetes bacterium]|nr:very short patch repair endonuclease [Planctomycetota bacterium]
MRSIRKTDTRPEVRVRSALHRMGYRFVLHRRDLPGVPDIVLPRHRTVVLVNGCFWHQHDCKARPEAAPEQSGLLAPEAPKEQGAGRSERGSASRGRVVRRGCLGVRDDSGERALGAPRGPSGPLTLQACAPVR